MFNSTKLFWAFIATLFSVMASATDVPFGRNLLKNTPPTGDSYEPWETGDGQQSWTISNGKLCSPYEESRLSQTVDLGELGLTTEQTDSLRLYCSLTYEVISGGDRMGLWTANVILLNADDERTAVHEFMYQGGMYLSDTQSKYTNMIVPKGTTKIVFNLIVKGQNKSAAGATFWNLNLLFANETPFFDGFEANSVPGNKIEGWQHKSLGEEEHYWSANNDDPYEGNSSANLESQSETWMFAPVHLKKGRRYAFSLSSMSTADSSKIAVMLGNSPDENSMNIAVVPDTTVATSEYQQLDCLTSTITSDDIYWLGIKGLTDEGVLSIDNVRLEMTDSVEIFTVDTIGSIFVNKRNVVIGDTITVGHKMKAGYYYTGYTTAPDVKWLSDSTFIVPDESVTIGLKRFVVNKATFFDGFESGNDHDSIVGGWLHQSLGGKFGDQYWSAFKGADQLRKPYEGDFCASLWSQSEAWMFTPVYLEKDKTYRFSLYTRRKTPFASVVSYPKISAMLGTAADKDSMKSFVIDETTISDSVYHQLSNEITVDSDGVYLLGIKGSTKDEYNVLSIDNIKLEALHTIVADTTLGSLTFNRVEAYTGDTIVILHSETSPNCFTFGFSTSSEVEWVSDTSFVMPDTDLTVGLKGTKLKTVPFFDGFENDDVSGIEVNGWVQQVETGDQYWTVFDSSVTDRKVYEGSKAANLWRRSTTWMFMPFYLEKGTKYTFSSYCQSAYMFYSKVSMSLGSAPDKDSMNTVLIEETSLNFDYKKLSTDFSIDSTGIYWIGIKGSTVENAGLVLIDNVSLEAIKPKNVIADPYGGTLTFDHMTAPRGDTVKIVAYELEDGYINMKSDTSFITSPAVEWVDQSTFIMPDTDVVVRLNVANILPVPYFEGFEEYTEQDQIVKDYIQFSTSSHSSPILLSNNDNSTEDCLPYEGEWNAMLDGGKIDGLPVLFSFFKLEKGKKYMYSFYAKQNGSEDIGLIFYSSGFHTSQEEDDVEEEDIEKDTSDDEDYPVINPYTDVLHVGDYQRFDHTISPVVSDTFFVGISFYILNEKISIDNISMTEITPHAIVADSLYKSISLSRQTAWYGDTITIQGYELKPGYEFVDFTANLELNWVSDSSFVMPDSDVVISATVKQLPTGVEDVHNQKISVADGRIFCDGEFRIYDIQGRDVTDKNGSLCGVYVVTTKNSVQKIVVQ